MEFQLISKIIVIFIKITVQKVQRFDIIWIACDALERDQNNPTNCKDCYLLQRWPLKSHLGKIWNKIETKRSKFQLITLLELLLTPGQSFEGFFFFFFFSLYAFSSFCFVFDPTRVASWSKQYSKINVVIDCNCSRSWFQQ